MEGWANALIQLGLAILVLGLLAVLGEVITGAFGMTVLPLTAQQMALGLQQLNQISNEYTNNTAVQTSVSNAETTLVNLVQAQYSQTYQGVTATGQAFVFLLNVLPMVVILVISVVVIALIFQVVNAVSGPGYRGVPAATM